MLEFYSICTISICYKILVAKESYGSEKIQKDSILNFHKKHFFGKILIIQIFG